MKKVFLVLIISLIGLLLFGCTQTDAKLNGKWVGESDSTYSMTFLDGKATVVTPFNTQTLNYTADGSNLILNSDSTSPQKVNYRFENNKLILTYGAGSAPNNSPSEIVETVYIRVN